MIRFFMDGGSSQWLLLILSLVLMMPSGQCLSTPYASAIDSKSRREVLHSAGNVAAFLLTDPFPVLAEDKEVGTADRPSDFTVVQETKLPFSQHYLENAQRLVLNLQWAAFHADADVDKQVKQQIVDFSSLYRRDNYTLYGPMPGSQNLLTAYSAAAEHYARYGFGTPMSERLINTINRNLGLAQKAMAKSDLSMERMMEERFN